MSLQKQTATAFALKIVTAIAAFLFNWLLSRLLGAKGVGDYQVVLTISMIAAIVAGLGLNNAVLRLISANIATGKFGEAKGYCILAIKYVTSATITTTIVFFFLVKFYFIRFFPDKENLVQLILCMSLGIIPIALINLFAEILKSFGKFQISLWVQSGITPILATLGVLLLYSAGIVNIENIIYLYILALWSNLIVSIFCYYFYKPIEWNSNSIILENKKELFISAVPLWTVTLAAFAMEYIDILLIGIWIGTKEAGIYVIAKKVAALNNFLLASTNTVVATQFASLFAQNKIESLKDIAQNATKTLFWSGLTILFLFTVFAKPILGIFGEDFKEGYWILIILSLGQFVNVATGSVGYLLIMTGNESLFRTNMIFTSILTILLFLTLIPFFSITGVALGSAIGLAFQNLRATWLVNKKLGFYTLGFLNGK